MGLPLTVLASVAGCVIRRADHGREAREAGVCDAYGSRLSCCNLDDAFRAAHDDVQHAIADIVNGIRGLRATEAPYGVFFDQLSHAQRQQVVAARDYRERQAMVPDLGIHGLEGQGLSYWELKLVRASDSTYPSGVRGGATGVEKRAIEVEREQVGRLADNDEQQASRAAFLWPALPPGPRALERAETKPLQLANHTGRTPLGCVAVDGAHELVETAGV